MLHDIVHLLPIEWYKQAYDLINIRSYCVIYELINNNKMKSVLCNKIITTALQKCLSYIMTGVSEYF